MISLQSILKILIQQKLMKLCLSLTKNYWNTQKYDLTFPISQQFHVACEIRKLEAKMLIKFIQIYYSVWMSDCHQTCSQLDGKRTNTKNSTFLILKHWTKHLHLETLTSYSRLTGHWTSYQKVGLTQYTVLQVMINVYLVPCPHKWSL